MEREEAGGWQALFGRRGAEKRVEVEKKSIWFAIPFISFPHPLLLFPLFCPRMRSNSFAALGLADAGASPSSTAAPLDAHEGSPPQGGGIGGGAAAGGGAEAISSASSARRRRRSRAASTPAEDSGSNVSHQANNGLLDASSLSFRFASECETAPKALGGSSKNRLLKTTSIDRYLGIDDAANSVERSSESAGSLSAASLFLTSSSAGGVGSGARTSSGVLSDGGGGSQQAGGGRHQRSAVPSLPTIAASPLGPSSLQGRPSSSPTKDRGGGSAAATATAAAAASAQNPFDGFVTPQGSPWAPAPLEAEGGGGGGKERSTGAAAVAAATLAAAPCTSSGGTSTPLHSAPPKPKISSSFRSYLHGELHPTPSLPTADVAWGQTERQRVYNALLAVPLHLERLLLLGGAVCADAWLAVLTLLPLRIGMAAVGGARWLLARGGRGGAAGRSGKEKQAGGAADADGGGVERGQEVKASPTSNPGALLYDLLCLLIFATAALTCCAVPVGALYFWMKDMTQEFLKLHVIYTAVDILDKIACSFSVDALDALAGTCALIAAAPASRRRGGGAAAAGSSAEAPRTPRSAAAAVSAASSGFPPLSSPYSRLSLVPHLLADALVAGAIVTAHAFVLLAHGVALSVAMHSKRGSTLLALTFASNFVEIKSAVFKRYDGRKLYTLACQDCVERFHLLAALAFVLVEAAAAGRGGAGSAAEPSPHSAVSAASASPASPASSFSFWSRPDPLLLARCGHVFAAEVAIDVIKHAVLSKFNEVRPGMYREFARDVAAAAADGGGRGQSHALYRRLLFDPLAPAALAVRMLVTAARARSRQAIAAAVAAANAAGGAEALGGAVSAAAAGSASGGGLRAALSACSSLLSLASTAAAWLVLWAGALAIKVALGFGLRVGCAAYLKHYDRRHGGLKRE